MSSLGSSLLNLHQAINSAPAECCEEQFQCPVVEPRSCDDLLLVSAPPRIDPHYIRHYIRHRIHCYDSSIRTTETDLAGSSGYNPYI